jgi:cellulose 1,4-beta-cellobiosidase
VTSPNASVDLFEISNNLLAPPRGEIAAVGPAGSSGALIISWNPVPGATGYVLKSVNLTTSAKTTIATLSGTSYTVTGLTNGTYYGFEVDSYDSVGTSVDGDLFIGSPVTVQ